MPYGYGFSPAESFDGTSSYIVWSEEWTEDRNDQNYNIYGARLDTDAVVDSFTVSQQPDTQAFPSIACCGVGRSLVVYQMYTDSINGHPVGEVRVWGVLYPSVGLPEGNPRSDISRLLTVSPNPFRGQAKFAWSLPQSGKTSLKVYDYTGRLVRRVFQGECHSGQGSAV